MASRDRRESEELRAALARERKRAHELQEQCAKVIESTRKTLEQSNELLARLNARKPPNPTDR